ncbi:MAG: ribosome maturation factor RimP [Oscillospiraceae bacterium]|nr:ribosome maturation factor RimP [Oscillospiraceae bacterium]
MAKKKNTVTLVRELVVPVAEQLGISIWDVQFLKEGPDWQLRIIIDKQGGVGIDDCEKLSRVVDPMLDELDPTDHPYCLIVSSPGLGRALKTDEHLRIYTGRAISVRLIRPDSDGERDFGGILTAYDADTITLDGIRVMVRKDAAFIKAADEDWEINPVD